MNPILDAYLAAHPTRQLIHPIAAGIMCGDAAGTLFLSQLIFWNLPSRQGKAKLRYSRDGKLWVVKAREDWLRETKITRDQYNRVMIKLVMMDLIEQRRVRFQGKVRCAIWLNDTTLEELAKQVLDGTPVRQPIVGKPDNRKRSIVGKPDNPYTEITNKQEQKPRDYSGASRGDAQEQMPDGADGAEQQRNNKNRNSTVSMALMERLQTRETTPPHHSKGPAMKAEDVVNKFKTRPPSLSDNVHVDCRSRWMAETAVKTERFVKKLTLKEEKLLKDACNGITEATQGGDPREVVTWALRHWGRFTEAAKAAAGLLTVPDEPHVGFFFKHWPHALKAMQEASAPPPPPKKKTVPIAQAVAPSPEPAAEADEAPLSYEETMALLKQGQQGS